MKIQTKFILISVFSIALVVGLAGFIEWSTAQQEEIDKDMDATFEVTQRHMEGDMMHDAIRADVLSVLFNVMRQDYAGVQQAKTDMAEHQQIFMQAYGDNMKEELPADLKASYDAVAPKLQTYVTAANTAVNDATQGKDVTSVLTSFIQQFEALEEDLGAITDQIAAWRTEEQAQADASAKLADEVKLIAVPLTILGVLLLPIMAITMIFRPQRRLINVMNALSAQDYSVEVIGTERKDEIGDIARAVQSFKESGEERVRLEKEQEKAREIEKIEAEKRAQRAKMTDNFAMRMQSIIENVAAAATELYRTSEGMGYSISSTTTRVNNVATASNQTSQNVQSVAAAAEQLSATVREISEQIARSSNTVQDAVRRVTEADKTATLLDEATKKIGQIVDVIQSIASQINLLALNATIESARAGEAGKGFAVVAGEVKTLATQTSKATDEIAANISSIQEVSQEVIGALQAIKGAISGVQEISSAISAAVEEQNATTNEIASNMGTAAEGTTRINEDIKLVSASTSESNDSAGQVLEAAKMLSVEAEKLNKEVSEFMSEMAA